jgi:hypothetical protein
MSRARAAPVCPASVVDKTLAPERGETAYWLCLGDEDVELLSQGICPVRVAQQAVTMLGWKRNR